MEKAILLKIGKRSVFVFMFTVMCMFSYGQKFSEPLTSLIEAERNFAATAERTNVKEAFLGSLGKEGVVFAQGEIKNGLEVWNKREANNALLKWDPVYADISAAGDFGYTTGPFVWAKDKTNPHAFSHGYYSSVWKKDENGTWKVLIDMGINTPQKQEVKPELASSSIASKGADKSGSSAQEIVRGLESSYIATLNQKKASFDLASLSQEIRIHRSGNFPFIGYQTCTQLTEPNKEFQFENRGIFSSASNDMLATYGTVTIKNTIDGTVIENKASYFRVWKKESGTQWKIVLDVIGT